MYIRPYTPSQAECWDSFVESSRNATFILQRKFMDYHADRFPDASVMLYGNDDRLLALFPATVSGKCASSHAGLTYGGWIMGKTKPDALQLLEAFGLLLDYYRNLGCDTLIYKAIPHVYHKYPAEEDLYALFVNGAATQSVLVSSVIDLSCPLLFNTGARRHVKRAGGAGLSVAKCDSFCDFWKILEERLGQRYKTTPVHSLPEIELLHERFPENIQLWEVRDASGKLLGGTVLFLCGHVVKAQYIASTDEGRKINAIDFLFYNLLQEFSALGYRYFDFGPSCENQGKGINAGLIMQKCGYGARAIVYNAYKIEL